MSDPWKPIERKVKVSRSVTKPYGVEVLMGTESVMEGVTVAQHTLDLIAGGMSVVQAAEQLGILEAQLIAYYRQKEERYDAYLEALACQAELDHQRYRDAALKLVEAGEDMDGDKAAIIDKGLNRFKDTIGWNNARFRKEGGSQVNIQVNVAEHLAKIAKARQIEGKVIETE